MIVDNGSSDHTLRQLEQLCSSEPAVTVEAMGKNTGSAPAFSHGIKLAAEQRPTYILLLDDDNWVEPDSLEKLIETQKRAADRFQDPLTSVCGYRDLDSNHIRIANGLPANLTYPPSGAFMFFDVLTQLRRLMFRPRPTELAMDEKCLPEAPYGGLLFPAQLLDVIGLPPSELRLYADDTFWTSRAVAKGHRLILDDSVTVHDADAKWARASGGGPLGLLDTESLEKLYFSVRNRVLFEKSLLRTFATRYRYSVNKAIYSLISRFVALRGRPKAAYVVYREAVRDAEMGRLDNLDWIGK